MTPEEAEQIKHLTANITVAIGVLEKARDQLPMLRSLYAACQHIVDQAARTGIPMKLLGWHNAS